MKQPERPVWLSSDARSVSDRGPVLTAAERVALASGHDPAADEPEGDNPPATIIQIPGGGHVDPPTR